MIRKLSSNPYSASEKIAELGLGQAAVEKKTKIGASPTVGAKKSEGGLGMAMKKISEQNNPEVAQENESDEDSDDLF